MDDVDAGDAGDNKVSSCAAVEFLACDWSVGRAGGGTSNGSGLEGLPPVTGLQTPELSSGQRKTSMGPRVLFSDTW